MSKKLAIALIVLTATLAALPSARAEGEMTLWGQVHTSSGTLVLNASACQTVDCHTTVTVKVFHAGEVKEFNTSILDGSYYSITIGSDGWSPGDAYEVWVDAVLWNDAAPGRVYYKAFDNVGLAEPRLYTFPTSTFGAVNKNLWAPDRAPSAPQLEGNLKPILALVFAAVLFLTALLFLVLLPRQKVAVEFTGKSKVTETVKGEQKVLYKYHCAYASATGSQPIGEIVRSEEDVELFQTREVSVSRIVKNPDGTFAWFDPRVVPLKDAAKQLRAAEPGQAAQVYTIEGKPLETMDGVMLEGLWRSGGKVTLHTGQEAKQAISRLKTTNFLVYGLPFFVVELLLGGVSAMTHPGPLSVPPFGLGLAVNLLILLVGVFGHITFFVMPTRPKLEKAKPEGPPMAGPEAPLEEPPAEELPPPEEAPMDVPPEEAPPPEDEELPPPN